MGLINVSVELDKASCLGVILSAFRYLIVYKSLYKIQSDAMGILITKTVDTIE